MQTSSIPHPEYPRPALVRERWQNLNGPWQAAFTASADVPARYDHTILVPFSPEAPLSGVNRQLQPGEFLHYRRSFTAEFGSGERVLLHFGAVDHACTVCVNGVPVGSHEGGYLPFTFDVTAALRPGENALCVCVTDPSDTGHQARGKQKLQRGGMYYTAQSGIWQTVWLETVPEQHITRLAVTPDLGLSCVHIRAEGSALGDCAGAVCEAYAGNEPVGRCTLDKDGCAKLTLANPHLWSPDDPFLYDLTVTLPSGDRVQSYFAMRAFGVAHDARGILRFTLNGKPILLNGLLDQGYWPEGLYTAPDDAALARDIERTKALGFNLLRKHAKIEPQRWYYHCDRLGMIVWQDMPNGGGRYNAWFVTYAINILQPLLRRFPDRFYRLLARTDARERERYYDELAQMVLLLGAHPCIGCFVPFNEGWGQFDAQKATALVRSLDPQSRPVDEASGWFDQGGGDVDSIHNYFYPLRVKPDKDRVVALSEYGGIAWPCRRTTDNTYGYGTAKTQEEFAARYEKLMLSSVLPQIARGLSALVYTQVSDVEDEVNGLFTYDREVQKLPTETVLGCAKALAEAFDACVNE